MVYENRCVIFFAYKYIYAMNIEEYMRRRSPFNNITRVDYADIVELDPQKHSNVIFATSSTLVSAVITLPTYKPVIASLYFPSVFIFNVSQDNAPVVVEGVANLYIENPEETSINLQRGEAILLIWDASVSLYRQALRPFGNLNSEYSEFFVYSTNPSASISTGGSLPITTYSGYVNSDPEIDLTILPVPTNIINITNKSTGAALYIYAVAILDVTDLPSMATPTAISFSYGATTEANILKNDVGYFNGLTTFVRNNPSILLRLDSNPNPNTPPTPAGSKTSLKLNVVITPAGVSHTFLNSCRIEISFWR